MATVIAMDIDECETAGKAKATAAAAALSINKSSGGKISKPASSLRRPGGMIQPSKPPPTSKVYNTDPTSFRELVQQLTGNSSSSSSTTATTAAIPAANTSNTASGGGGGGGGAVGGGSGYSGYSGGGGIISGGSSTLQQQSFDHPRMAMGLSQQQQQRHQVVTDPALLITTGVGGGVGGGGGVLSPQSSARPVNSRLQRMAPPPLRPTFPAFKLPPQQQQQYQGGAASGGAGSSATSQASGENNNNNNNLTSPGAQPLSPLSNKRVSPVMPLLSFSPLPVLSPSDTAWANFESPNTAAMKQLAQSIGGAFAGGRFPWSPTFQGCGLGLPSPGLAVPELFPEVNMIDSPENMKKTAAAAAGDADLDPAGGGGDFSFPEIRGSS